MKIQLKDSYKSLEPFESQILPDFCVITGKNGSGKTQLIELIEKMRDNANASLEIDVNRLKIQIGGLDHPSTNYLDAGNWMNKITEFWTDYSTSYQLIPTLQCIFKSDSTLSLLTIAEDELSDIILSEASHEVKQGLDSVSTFGNSQQVSIQDYAINASRQILLKRLSFEIAKMVSEKTKKKFAELSYQDFMKFPPDEKYIDNQHLFYSSIEKIFYAYAKRRYLNFTYYCANKELNKNYDCLSDSEFLLKYERPWIIANKIFDKHNINYSFEDISPDIFVENIPIDFKLRKKSSGKRIDFTNLSTGEKVIIALVVKLFTTEFYSKNLELPELIVLDEPDAHLHPQLAKLLIDVLNETIVNELGVKVLITTHSPSTVALAPELSLFELRNEPETSLNKISKDEALKILTFGVPTLSIDYKNHRQIFVESPTDVFYYQNIYDALSQKEQYTFKPYFISYGKGHGNCDQVITLVNSLRGSGNEKSFGIVDWDGKRGKNDFVFIHGDNTHYSIENFIYDPIYLVSYFLEIGGAESVFSELGFKASYNQYTLGENEPKEKLQEISNWVISKIRSKFNSLPELNASKVSVEYLNNKQIYLPKWYLEMKGHELEEKLKEVFPSLAGKFRAEGQMQESLTKVIAKSYPFLPMETVELIREIVR